MMLGHNRKMLGAECMADMLEAYGVTHVFHVPAVLRKTFAVMETRTKIKRLHVHSEATAAYMADGYARASGKPGICMAQVIGALNLAAGLRDAWLAHSPVIAFTGGREPKTKFRKVYQEVDDMPAFEPRNCRCTGPGVPVVAARNAARTMSGKRFTSSTVAFHLVTGSNAGTSSTS